MCACCHDMPIDSKRTNMSAADASRSEIRASQVTLEMNRAAVELWAHRRAARDGDHWIALTERVDKAFPKRTGGRSLRLIDA